jgi:hypothetical protein
MAGKKTSYLAAVLLLLGGTFFTVIAISFLPSVRSHGWINVWQPGSVGLLMLVFGALDLWLGLRSSRGKRE